MTLYRWPNSATAVILAVLGTSLSSASAVAHPHIMVDANLEIVRNAEGEMSELRHVWRFDELFSSSVLLDFDANADGALDVGELDEVSKIVTESIGENGFFTEIRQGSQNIAFKAPDAILVDYVEDQLLMFFAVELESPAKTSDTGIRISVSDPSYYVALDIPDENAVKIAGNETGCSTSISRPDFDNLLSGDVAKTEAFFTDPGNSDLGDEWKTWISVECE